MAKPLLRALAVAAAALLFTGTARADCWWDGYNWNCSSYGPAYSPHYGYYPYDQRYSYPPYDYSYYYGYRYPGPKLSGSGYYYPY